MYPYSCGRRGGSSSNVSGDISAILAAKDAAIAAAADAAASAADAQATEDQVTALAATVDAQEAAIEDISGQVSEDADTSNAAANAAVAAADLADRMANEVPGVEVLPGKFSGNHYLEATRAAAAIAASFKKRTLTDADFPSGNRVVNNNDLFRTLEVRTTGVNSIKLPVNLWQVLDENGDPTEAWIRFRYHKDGTTFPTFVADSVPVVLNPAVLATAIFPFAAEPAVTSPTQNYVFNVPAGTGRRACFLLQAIYDSPNPVAARNTVLTASGTTGLTKAGPDSSSTSYTSGGAISSSLWEAQVTGTSAAAVSITITPDGNVLSYVLYALAANNALSFQATPVNLSIAAIDTQHELTLNPIEDKCISVFLIGHQGNDALPLTAGLSGGTLVASGKTPKSRASKDIAYVAGYDFVPTAGPKTYASTSDKVAKGAVTGVIIRPDTAGMVTSILTAPGGATLSTPGKACTICIHSDGINYTKEDSILATSPVTLLGPRLRAGVYTLGTYVQPPALPRVSVLDRFDEVTRNVSLPVTATVRLVRTPPFADPCSVQWHVIGVAPTPITSSYFSPIGLPFGLGIFQAGQQYLDITLTFSSGALPPTDLFGVFEVFGASGCTVLASQSSFQFRLLENPPFAAPWVWDEPTWIPRVSYAAAPNKVEVTTAADLATLATAQAGRTYVIDGDIDGGGGTFTITAAGTQASPVRIMASVAVGGATVRNCIFRVSSSSYLLVDGINFDNASFLLSGVGSFLQFERNEFTNLTTETGDGAIRIMGECRYRYMRFYGNEVGNLHGVPYDAIGFTTAVIIPKVNNTNHWKYLWVERNLFKNFAAPSGHRNQSVFLGEANPDSDKNCFITFKDNMILDAGDAAIWEMKLSGNMRILGNTIERSSTAVPAVVAKTRFGSIKERSGVMPTGSIVSAVGSLIEGNLFVTPEGSTFPCGGLRMKDAGHRIVHNWGVRLAPGEQPTVNSPLNGSTIGLGFGNMDMTWWPEVVADVPREERTGRYFINTGFNVVAGNRMTVQVGSEENALKPGETLWSAINNTVSAASPLRTDRNAAVTIFPEPRQVNTMTNVAVLGVDYNRIPVRILPSTCGRNAP